jgi:hypothetical protein
MKTRSPKSPKTRAQREKNKDPYRKRSFDPDPAVAPLLETWSERNQHVKFGWMVNRAIEEYTQRHPKV